MPDLLHCAGCRRPYAQAHLCPECSARMEGPDGTVEFWAGLARAYWPCVCGHSIRSHVHPTLKGRRTHCSHGCGCLEYRPQPLPGSRLDASQTP